MYKTAVYRLVNSGNYISILANISKKGDITQQYTDT